jgi:hypothetical protein
MSFHQLKLFRRRGTPPPTGVAIGTTKGRAGLSLALTVRRDVAQSLGWKTGDRVGVAFGEGTDEGLVALFRSPEGLKLYGPKDGPGGGWGGRIIIDSTHLPLELAAGRPSEEVAHESKDGALVIVLPAWAYQKLPPVPLSQFRVVDNRTMGPRAKAEAKA